MAVTDITTKCCTKCGENKALVEFNKSSSTKDGFRRECRRCAAAYYQTNKDKLKACMAAWRLANRERLKAAKAAWDKANPEKRRKYGAKYRAENIEKTKARSAKRYASNPEKHKALMAEWRANNPEKCKALAAKWQANNLELKRIYSHNRRFKQKSGALSKDIASRLYKAQKGKCACCGKPLGDDYHLDHKMPLALGGTNTDDNIQLLCPTCNLSKGAKHPVDFMQQRGFLL